MEPVRVPSMDPAAEDRLMLALTTEHFTLQTARSATISESAGRAALFLFMVSSGIVALAFAGQSSGLGPAFDLLALTILPVLVLLGSLTYLRLVQSAVEDLRLATEIERIRARYREIAPEATRYFRPLVHVTVRRRRGPSSRVSFGHHGADRGEPDGRGNHPRSPCTQPMRGSPWRRWPGRRPPWSRPPSSCSTRPSPGGERHGRSCSRTRAHRQVAGRDRRAGPPIRGPQATARGASVSQRGARHEFVTSGGDRAGMRLHWLLIPAGILVVVAALAVPAASAPGDIASKRQQVAELDRELSAVDAEAGAAAAAHNAALDRRDAVARRIGETRIEVRLTARQLRSSRERLGERMVALYVRETPDPFEALLQSGDLADVLAVTDLLERTAASDAAVVAKVRERRQALERLRARLAADAVVAGRELAEAQSQRRRVEALLDTRRRALEGARAELGSLLAAERARLARLAAQKKEAQEEARRAAATSVASHLGLTRAGVSASRIPPGLTRVGVSLGRSRIRSPMALSSVFVVSNSLRLRRFRRA